VATHFRVMGGGADDVLVYTDMPGPTFMVDLERAIETHHPVLVVIDGLFRLIRVSDASDYVQMSRGLEPLLHIARRHNPHILATHHSPKSDESADGVLGSTAIFGTVDCLLRIKRSDGGERTLTTIQRYGEDLPETVLVLDPVTGRTSAGGLKFDGTLARLGQALLESLSDGHTTKESDLLDSLEGRRSLKILALRQLRESGKVTQSGKGKKGDPYRYAIPVPDLGRGTRNRKSEEVQEPEDPADG